MKRSEMAKKMDQFVREIEEDFSCNTSEQACYRLLIKLEEAGMLPPKAVFVTDQLEGMLHQWEPEDDPDDSDKYCGIV